MKSFIILSMLLPVFVTAMPNPPPPPGAPAAAGYGYNASGSKGSGAGSKGGIQDLASTAGALSEPALHAAGDLVGTVGGIESTAAGLLGGLGGSAGGASPRGYGSGGPIEPWFACAGSPGNAQCCATDVLGVADLDCAPPTRTPHSRREFDDVCAAKGQRARCCALPILQQALICSGPA